MQRWQTRNWFLQQRFLGQEKEYLAFKELADEIASLLGVRIFRMQLLIRAIASRSGEKIGARCQEYDEALKRWNDRLTSFYIRLEMLAHEGLAIRLERSIQDELVRIGEKIERLEKQRRKGSTASAKEVKEVENALNNVQAQALTFNKELLAAVHSRRADIYFGKRLNLSPGNLQYFSTWQLIKALFVRDIDSFSIVRSPLDS